MKTLEQLLAEWEEGTLTAEGVQELKKLLARPEARKELVGEWLLYEAVYGTLRAIPAPVKPTLKFQQQAAVKAAPPRLVRQSVPRRRFLPWVVWHEFRLPLRWAFGVCLVLCLGWLAFSGIYLRLPAGRLAEVKKEVTIQRGGKTIAAQAGQLIYPRDTIKVSAGGLATLEWLKEATSVELTANASLEVRNPLFGKSLNLQIGSLQASVAPQPSWRPMTIKTPQAEATVVGTRFTMQVVGDSMRLEVLHGAVSVRKLQPHSTAEQEAVLVKSGEAVQDKPGTALKLEAMRGFALRDIVELPSSGQPVSGPGEKVVFTDQLPNLISEGHPRGFATAVDTRYEERIRFYIYPPTTGNYTFWYASGGKGEMWLSASHDPAGKQRIISKGKGAASGFAWQLMPASSGQERTVMHVTGKPVVGARLLHGERSRPVKLDGGKPYYLEIIQPFAPNELRVVWWIQPGQVAGSSGEVPGGNILAPYAPTPVLAARKSNP